MIHIFKAFQSISKLFIFFKSFSKHLKTFQSPFLLIIHLYKTEKMDHQQEKALEIFGILWKDLKTIEKLCKFLKSFEKLWKYGP